ncbi:hypothetical protein CC2G_001932 [Coprinopsis cinerea AmutBmut pab1-1]|nr:hypothetical protein CC2G_001932 [Coprinopsis cinerea AmutBmut pab1-1]
MLLIFAFSLRRSRLDLKRLTDSFIRTVRLHEVFQALCKPSDRFSVEINCQRLSTEYTGELSSRRHNPSSTSLLDFTFLFATAKQRLYKHLRRDPSQNASHEAV